MLEMASLGAKVLQTRSVEYAKNYGVPVHVRSSFNSNPGTMVVKEDAAMERVVVSGIAYNKHEAKITVTRVADRPGIAASLFGRVAEANIVVDMIVQNISQDGFTDISFTVPKADYAKTMDIVKAVAREIGADKVIGDDKIAKVSIVGVGMRTHSGVAARMFESLGKEKINILMISTSEIKVSCVIEAKYTELAVRILHEAFGLGAEAVTQERCDPPHLACARDPGSRHPGSPRPGCAAAGHGHGGGDGSSASRPGAFGRAPTSVAGQGCPDGCSCRTAAPRGKPQPIPVRHPRHPQLEHG
jgi:aspartate kinase